MANITDIINNNHHSLENDDDLALIKDFLKSITLKYYDDFVFRCVFDRVFRSGLYTYEYPKTHVGKARISQEKKLCDLFYQLANHLAKGYCPVYKKKKRPYEMLSLMLFNHYKPFEGKVFADIGSHSNHEIIFKLFGAKRHIQIESPDYIKIHGEISDVDKHKVKRNDSNVVYIRSSIEELKDEDILSLNIDRFFSQCCFEHIMNLELALEKISIMSSPNAYLYSTFYPIYSSYQLGQHGTVPKEIIDKIPAFHSYNINQQRDFIKEVYPQIKEQEIMDKLGSIYFNPSELVNRFTYEDYRKYVLKSNFNIVVFDEINFGSNWSEPKILEAYRNQENTFTSFPDILGIRLILKIDQLSIYDTVMSTTTASSVEF